jgi:hypothetical protein
VLLICSLDSTVCKLEFGIPEFGLCIGNVRICSFELRFAFPLWYAWCEVEE